MQHGQCFRTSSNHRWKCLIAEKVNVDNSMASNSRKLMKAKKWIRYFCRNFNTVRSNADRNCKTKHKNFRDIYETVSVGESNLETSRAKRDEINANFRKCSAALKMSPLEKLIGCQPRNRIANNLGLEYPDATLETLVKLPNEKLSGSKTMDALQLAGRVWELSHLGKQQEWTGAATICQWPSEKPQAESKEIRCREKEKRWKSKFGGKP